MALHWAEEAAAQVFRYAELCQVRLSPAHHEVGSSAAPVEWPGAARLLEKGVQPEQSGSFFHLKHWKEALVSRAAASALQLLLPQPVLQVIGAAQSVSALVLAIHPIQRPLAQLSSHEIRLKVC